MPDTPPCQRENQPRGDSGDGVGADDGVTIRNHLSVSAYHAFLRNETDCCLRSQKTSGVKSGTEGQIVRFSRSKKSVDIVTSDGDV